MSKKKDKKEKKRIDKLLENPEDLVWNDKIISEADLENVDDPIKTILYLKKLFFDDFVDLVQKEDINEKKKKKKIEQAIIDFSEFWPTNKKNQNICGEKAIELLYKFIEKYFNEYTNRSIIKLFNKILKSIKKCEGIDVQIQLIEQLAYYKKLRREDIALKDKSCIKAYGYIIDTLKEEIKFAGDIFELEKLESIQDVDHIPRNDKSSKRKNEPSENKIEKKPENVIITESKTEEKDLTKDYNKYETYIPEFFKVIDEKLKFNFANKMKSQRLIGLLIQTILIDYPMNTHNFKYNKESIIKALRKRFYIYDSVDVVKKWHTKVNKEGNKKNNLAFPLELSTDEKESIRKLILICKGWSIIE